MRWISLCGLSLACAAPVDGLEPTSARDAGTPSPQPDPPKGECPAPLDDLFTLNRVGLMTSEAIVVGMAGPIRVVDDGLRLPLEITEVVVGPYFLNGLTVDLAVDEVEAQAFADQALIVGFAGNTLPLFEEDRATWWWHQVLIPAAEAGRYEDLLKFRPSERMAVVRITGQDEYRTHFTTENMFGRVPSSFSANWGKNTFAVPFPAPSDVQYLAVLHPEGGSGVESIFDFRPWSSEVRALALSEPPPTLHAPLEAAIEAAELYLDAYRFHRAPHAVAAEVTGLAGECCTGAGGEYVQHAVTFDFRGTFQKETFVRGGHGYYSEEICGDRAIFALGDEPSEPVEASSFSCVEWETALDTGLGVPSTIAARPDTPENRQMVQTWLDSAPPRYQIHEVNEDPPPGSDGWWSDPIDALSAVRAGVLAWIDIQSVEEGDGVYDVQFATSFHDTRFEHLEMFERKITARCMDPRLTQVGAEWLVPVAEERAFIVPGVVLPRYGYITRVAAARP